MHVIVLLIVMTVMPFFFYYFFFFLKYTRIVKQRSFQPFVLTAEEKKNYILCDIQKKTSLTGGTALERFRDIKTMPSRRRRRRRRNRRRRVRTPYNDMI